MLEAWFHVDEGRLVLCTKPIHWFVLLVAPAVIYKFPISTFFSEVLARAFARNHCPSAIVVTGRAFAAGFVDKLNGKQREKKNDLLIYTTDQTSIVHQLL